MFLRTRVRGGNAIPGQPVVASAIVVFFDANDGGRTLGVYGLRGRSCTHARISDGRLAMRMYMHMRRAWQPTTLGL